MGEISHYTEEALRGRLRRYETLRQYQLKELDDDLTQIEYKIGPSALAHLLGILTLGIANIGMEIGYCLKGRHLLYFDTKTKSYLGHTIGAVADDLRRKGQRSYDKKEFEQAKQFFQRAFNVADPTEKNHYKELMDQAEIKVKEEIQNKSGLDPAENLRRIELLKKLKEEEDERLEVRLIAQEALKHLQMQNLDFDMRKRVEMEETRREAEHWRQIQNDEEEGRKQEAKLIAMQAQRIVERRREQAEAKKKKEMKLQSQMDNDGE